MKLVEALITGDKKHYEAVKTWVQQQKLSLNDKIWPLVKIILVDTEIHVEKKFRTIVLRQVLQQVEAGGCSPELLAMVSLLSPGRKTEKQLSLWLRAGEVKRETQLAAHTEVHSRVLLTLQENKGSLDTRIMRECFLPLLDHIADNLKTDLSSVLELCHTAALCREKVENKVSLHNPTQPADIIFPSRSS